ncbi:DoxX family membrane protein [Halalkalicoccus subterraneus]|uniref:DoxX family membrane protein n=1 Tax=Halalkalicoccus subterraneus TaxID=2675002 RepID=UPI001FE373A3|nr:DoxX family membrane protein [Halalkalicoccus subterraneus]
MSTMETTTGTTTEFENVPTEGIRSRIAGVAVGLRLLMGWIFLTAGIGKLTGEPFDAAGYLANVDPTSPTAGLYGAMAANPMLMDLINVAVPWGQVLIGLGLLVGGLVRVAAFFGALQMAAFYFGNWELAGAYEVLTGFVTSELVYLAVLVAIGALAAGRYWGLDAIIARYEREEVPVAERYPRLRYLLG